MKLRIKILLSSLLIVAVSLGFFAWFILRQQRDSLLADMQIQGSIHARIISRSVFNSLLMNGGDPEAAKIDTSDSIKMMKPLEKKGLVSVVSALNAASFKGFVLAEYASEQYADQAAHPGQRYIAEDLLNSWLKTGESQVACGTDELCHRFTEVFEYKGKPVIVTAVTLSRRPMEDAIRRTKHGIYFFLGIAVVLSFLVSWFLSSALSRNFAKLTRAVRLFERRPDENVELAIRSKDEAGELAATFEHMAEVISRQVKELKEMDRLKDQLLANTTHELKTPLNGIIGLSSAMKSALAAGEYPSAESLDLIHYSARRLNRMVDGLLDMSKIRHKDMSLEKAEFPLSLLCLRAASLLRPLAVQKGIELRTFVEHGVYVTGDPEKLEQVIINLVSNAVKFTSEGFVSLNLEIRENTAILRVTDTGIGIPEAEHEKIFESFYQVSGEASRAYEGTGLGLAVTKSIVEGHGGTICVESETEEGSTFTVKLPNAKMDKGAQNPDFFETWEARESAVLPNPQAPVAEEGISPVPPVDSSGIHGTILVVDDDPINLRAVTANLKQAGHHTVTAESAFAAKQLMESGAVKPDLVLLDVMMPKLNGFEFTKILRESKSLYELPILLLTAKIRSSDIVKGLSAGANDYITKPFESSELFARIKTHLMLKKAVEDHHTLNSIRSELEMAKKIQNSVLPPFSVKTSGAVLEALYIASAEVGGDFFDYHIGQNGAVGVLIADVSGHGIASALISSMTKVAFSVAADHLDQPATILRSLNQILQDKLDGHFITAQYIYIDPAARKIISARAGHNPSLLFSRSRQSVMELNPRGPAIGFFPDPIFVMEEHGYEIGDRLLLYTDGITETSNAQGELFSEVRLTKLLTDGAADPKEFLATMLDSVERFRGVPSGENKSPDDDLTAVVIDLL